MGRHVLAGGLGIWTEPAGQGPELGRAVADRIAGARFEVLEEEAHQPFQEIPEEGNARVDAFWKDVDTRA